MRIWRGWGCESIGYKGSSYFMLASLSGGIRRDPLKCCTSFTEAEEARAAMLAASEALGLPALGRCE